MATLELLDLSYNKIEVRTEATAIQSSARARTLPA